MTASLRWGVLGAARIATQKVIPAMQRGRWSRVDAIASRSLSKAQAAASSLGIPRAYVSYDALLDDPDIDAVYIPLPNHEHVSWAVRAAESGKHVLVEKPAALDEAGVRELIAARDRTGKRIQEAFMIRSHPQWEAAIAHVRDGSLGRVHAVHVFFSYRNLDPHNIRNIASAGGGALMDIGCYIVHAARWIFDAEPARVETTMDMDPTFKIDRLTSMLLDFGDGRHAVGTCATQLAPYQRVQIIGDKARLEIEIPFNAPPDQPCRIFIDDGADLGGGSIRAIEFPPTDQYTVQGDRLSRAILDGRPAPLPLEDSLKNLRAMDQVRAQAQVVPLNFEL